jgi:hypothetical protein
MSARKPPRRAKAQPKRSHHESLKEANDGLLTLQGRLYAAKSHVRAAAVLANEEDEHGDLWYILDNMTDELESIANAMGNFLPLYIPEVQS